MPALTTLLKAGKEWSWVSSPESAAACGVPYPYAGFANYAFMALFPYPRVAETWGPLYNVGNPLGTQNLSRPAADRQQADVEGYCRQRRYTYSRTRSNVDSGFQESWGVGCSRT